VVEAAEQTVADALPVFAAAGDDLGAAHAYHLSAFASWLKSRAMECVAALDEAVEHARRIDARGPIDQAAMMMMGPLRFGPLTPTEVQERLELIRASDSVPAQHVVLLIESHLASQEGRFDDALEKADRAAAFADSVGLPPLATVARWEAAHHLVAAEQLERAIEGYGRVAESFEAFGQTSFRSTVLLDLARAHYRRGDLDEAERLVAEGQAVGAIEDVINFAYGEELRARITADRGDTTTAEPIARDALAYAYRTDFPSAHASAHETLAHVLAAAGRDEEARIENTRAFELWERYGYRLESIRVRALL
jgi:tetratricopeptide (TPR) repeat protein